MFKNLNEFITLCCFIGFALVLLRMLFSYLFNINKDTFSLKYMFKRYYDNEDE